MADRYDAVLAVIALPILGSVAVAWALQATGTTGGVPLPEAVLVGSVASLAVICRELFLVGHPAR